jgi:hypothetical protein
VGPQSGDNRPVGKVFHFFDLPTVTAGFIGFVFDIREVPKVAAAAFVLGGLILLRHSFFVVQIFG